MPDFSVAEISWQWQAALYLLALPLLLLLIPAKQANNRLYFPQARFLQPLATKSTIDGYALGRWLLWYIVWSLLCLGLARPIVLGEPLALPREGRNLMLAVDISGSMREQDMIINNRRVDRLTMVKTVIDEFIAQRQGDKVGLILFGTQAFLQSPLSYDLKTVQELLNESVIGLAGENTAIGDAIGLGVKHTQNFAGDRVLILLTDGRNTAGKTSPLQATQFAKQAGLKIYTIGIGRPSLLRQGVDVKLINAIASEANGKSYLVSNANELHNIYEEINQLEPSEDNSQNYRITYQLYAYFVMAALGLSLLMLLWQAVHRWWSWSK